MAFSRSSSVSFFIFLLFAVLINQTTSSRVSSVIKLPVAIDDETIDSYCESRRLAIESNNAGSWKKVPSNCVRSLKTYYENEGQFEKDYNVAARYALSFAKTVTRGADGKVSKDAAWVFDIDETLLSNLEYYKANGYGSKEFDPITFNEWVLEGRASNFEAGLTLYNGLKELGFTIFLLTGRDEGQKKITEQNLEAVGYSGWEDLLLRGVEDQGKGAVEYKSHQRSKMVYKGFKLHGNIGDQWSDLQGYAVANRSFKVPNPMYYIG